VKHEKYAIAAEILLQWQHYPNANLTRPSRC